MPKSLLFITSINVSDENKGSPSSLAFALAEELSKYDSYRFCCLPPISSPVSILLRKLGIFNQFYIFKLVLRLIKISPNYKLIIFCYPAITAFSLLFTLLIFRKHIHLTVVGPDCSTLLFKRIRRESNDTTARFKYSVLYWYFLIVEYLLIKISDIFCVVGKADARFLMKYDLYSSKKVRYLPHPVPSSYTSRILPKKAISPALRLIVFGDCSPKYVGKYSAILIDALRANSKIYRSIIVIGKKSEWMYSKIKKSIPDISISYYEWVNNLQEFANPSSDIHLFPLAAGAGTKNRVLASQAFQCYWLGTKIAIENIPPYLSHKEHHQFNDLTSLNYLLSNLKFLHKQYISQYASIDFSLLEKRQIEFRKVVRKIIDNAR